VKLQHFETLRPVCPVCRSESQTSPLRIGAVVREEHEAIVEGTLHCTNSICQREYPIIDGIPLIIAALRSYLSDNLTMLLARDDLAEITESLIGDCCGPGTWFDTQRQQLSSYTWDHYADLDPLQEATEPEAGAIVRLLEEIFPYIERLPEGPILDVGCGVGRTSYVLAQKCQRLVLGIDIHLGMLRMAQNILRTGRVRYGRRRIGVVYDRRDYPVELGGRDRVDFWACDATALPFTARSWAMAVCLNVLDSVHAPADLLQSLAACLAPSGRLALACPYDWSSSVTPLEAWIGGHSQRGAHRGAAESLVRALLTPEAHPNSVPNLEVIAEQDGLAWSVRVHERSTMLYRLHLMVAEAEGR
jgi:SAM-dependent methyltransferase/uncharacterized protein YbaR (Trm112 family)